LSNSRAEASDTRSVLPIASDKDGPAALAGAARPAICVFFLPPKTPRLVARVTNLLVLRLEVELFPLFVKLVWDASGDVL
jgi:hypothetical protein